MKRDMLNITDTVDEKTRKLSGEQEGYEIYSDQFYFIYYVTYEKRICAVTENSDMAYAAREAQIERDRRDNS